MTIQIRQYTNPKPGSYAIYRIPLQWLDCRERLQGLWKPGPNNKFSGIFFSHNIFQKADIESFIFKTESLLFLDTKTKFIDTNFKNISFVEPCQFWLNCCFRRSLFTLLLRTSLKYSSSKDNYEEALFSHTLSKTTRNAITRFLLGNTKVCHPDSKGWHSLFENRSDDELKNLLRPSDPYEGVLSLV